MQFEGFSDIEYLDEGGLGRVYRAVRTSTGAAVALKEIKLFDEGSPAAARARREAEALAKLKGHPHVVSVEEVLDGPEGPVLVMEYLDAGNVAQRLEHGPLLLQESLRIGIAVLSAVGASHSEKIVHRDLKPHNVLLGSYGQIKVCDFGIAAIAREGGHNTRTNASTLAYASPEEIDESADIAAPADVYSFCVMFTQMLTGKRPSHAERLAGHALDDIDARLAPLGELLQRGMSTTPDDRPSVAELAAALDAAAERVGGVSHAPTPTPRPPAPTSLPAAATPGPARAVVVPPSASAPGGDSELHTLLRMRPAASAAAPALAVAAASETPKTRRNWRLIGIVTAGLAAVLLVLFFVLGAQARRGYFVAFNDDGHVTVYRGRDGGLLWWNPQPDSTIAHRREQLTVPSIGSVEARPSFSSLDDTNAWIAENVVPRTPPAAPPAPEAQTALERGIAPGTVRLGWEVPESDGGSPITLYTVQRATEPTSDTDAGAVDELVWVDAATTTSRTFNATGLTAGREYQFRIVATNSVGASAPSETLAVVAVGVPGAPQSVATEPQGADAIEVSWIAPQSDGGAAVTGYLVERSTDGNEWELAGDATGRSLVDSGLPAGSNFRYRVAATNAAGAGQFSRVAEATTLSTPGAPTLSEPLTPPAGGLGPGDVRLRWNAPTSDGGAPITGFQVQRRSQGDNWETVGTTTEREFVVRDNSTETSYEFRVFATNAIGDGLPSAVVQAVAVGAPSAPTAVRATTAPSSGLAVGEIRLTWGAPPSTGGEPIVHYQTQRRDLSVPTDDPSWENLDTTSQLSFTASGHTGGNVYEFRVLAVSAVGHGAPSAVVTVTAVGPPMAPTEPVLTAAPIDGLGAGEVRVSWNPPASDGGAAISEYRVERLVDAETADTEIWEAVATTAELQLTVPGNAIGAVHQFRVVAINAAGEGLPSEPRSTAAVGAPAAPAAVSAATTPAEGVTPQAVRLEWEPPTSSGGSPIVAYRVERLTPEVGWEAVGETPELIFTVNGNVPGEVLRFRVVALNAVGASAPSDELEVTPVGPSGPPTGLHAIAGPTDSGLLAGEAQLTWNPPDDDGGLPISVYRVQQRIVGTEWGDAFDSEGTEAVATGLPSGESVEFRVIAISDAGRGRPSEPATILVFGAPASPTGLVAESAPAEGVEPGTVRLHWTPPYNTGGQELTGYSIHRMVLGGDWQTEGDWETVGHSIEPTATIGGNTGGVTYEFRVVADNALPMTGLPSEPATALVLDRPDPPAALHYVVAPDDELRPGEIRLTWDAPARDGGLAVTGYRIYRLVNDEDWELIDVTTEQSYTVGGNVGGRTYTFRVAADNELGAGPPAEAWVTAVGAPSSPVPVIAAAAPADGLQPGEIRLTWEPPAVDGGQPITLYGVHRSGAGSDWGEVAYITEPTVIIAGHVGGEEYSFRVFAFNELAWSAPTETEPVVAFDVPEPPADIQSVAAPGGFLPDGHALTTWSPPHRDGGMPIVTYHVERSMDGGDWALIGQTEELAFADLGLVNGASYRYRVAAGNALGAGVPAEAAAVMPTTAPPPQQAWASGRWEWTVVGADGFTTDVAIEFGPVVSAAEARQQPGDFAALDLCPSFNPGTDGLMRLSVVSRNTSDHPNTRASLGIDPIGGLSIASMLPGGPGCTAGGRWEIPWSGNLTARAPEAHDGWAIIPGFFGGGGFDQLRGLGFSLPALPETVWTERRGRNWLGDTFTLDSLIPPYYLAVPAGCAVSVDRLAIGDQGSDVMCLETRLAEVTVGEIGFAADGSFDEHTEAAIRLFQAAHGLEGDGVASLPTLRHLGLA